MRRFVLIALSSFLTGRAIAWTVRDYTTPREGIDPLTTLVSLNMFKKVGKSKKFDTLIQIDNIFHIYR